MFTESQLAKIAQVERRLRHLTRLVRARRYRQSLARVIDISTARNRCGVN